MLIDLVIKTQFSQEYLGSNSSQIGRMMFAIDTFLSNVILNIYAGNQQVLGEMDLL